MEKHDRQKKHLRSTGRVVDLKHYHIEITSKAYDDMDHIYTYIAEELLEPNVAANQYDRISEAILSLDIMPERIKIMDSEPARTRGLRPLIVDNYTVLFTIESDTVFIVRVIYSASDISKRLSEE
jgi:plasmid stabilization system protein ParE